MTIRRCLVMFVALLAIASASFAIDAPTELTAIETGGNIVLRWQPVAGATEYNVFRETTLITDVSLLFPYTTVMAPTVTYTDASLGTQHYYVVTAVVPSGDLSGTVRDSLGTGTGPGAQGALVWVAQQADPSVTGMDYCDVNGAYEILDLPVGTYDLCIYKENRPVHTTTVVINDGGATVYDYQWPVFARTVIAAGILAPGVYNWTNNNVYEMAGIVRVGPGATLNVEEGTTINGSSVVLPDSVFPPLAYLNVMASTTGDGSDNGVLNVSGSKYKPVVFTSGRLPVNGVQRNADWGGIIIDGDASTNRGRLSFGEGGTGPYGNVGTTNDTQSSGTLRYFRIDYAGFNFTATNQLNGLCLQGVGSGTIIQYGQSFEGEDDGIEFFGGACSIDHWITTSCGDDAFDYTSGWRGSAHHVVTYARRSVSDRGIEADNKTSDGPQDPPDYNALPRSNSRLANFTVIGGKGSPAVNSAGANPRAGTQFNWFNMIFTLNRAGGVDIDDSPTSLAGTGGASRLDYSIFWNNGEATSEAIDPATGVGIGDGHFIVENGEWDNTNCVALATFPLEPVHFSPVGWTQDVSGFRGCGYVGSNATNQIVDPLLVNPTGFDPRPVAGSPALVAASAAPAGTLASYGLPYAPYIGAFSGPNDDWHIGWSR